MKQNETPDAFLRQLLDRYRGGQLLLMNSPLTLDSAICIRLGGFYSAWCHVHMIFRHLDV